MTHADQPIELPTCCRPHRASPRPCFHTGLPATRVHCEPLQECQAPNSERRTQVAASPSCCSMAQAQDPCHGCGRPRGDAPSPHTGRCTLGLGHYACDMHECWEVTALCLFLPTPSVFLPAYSVLSSFLPPFLLPPFLPSSLPSSLPSFLPPPSLPPFLPLFLPSFLLPFLIYFFLFP